MANQQTRVEKARKGAKIAKDITRGGIRVGPGIDTPIADIPRKIVGSGSGARVTPATAVVIEEIQRTGIVPSPKPTPSTPSRTRQELAQAQQRFQSDRQKLFEERRDRGQFVKGRDVQLQQLQQQLTDERIRIQREAGRIRERTGVSRVVTTPKTPTEIQTKQVEASLGRVERGEITSFVLPTLERGNIIVTKKGGIIEVIKPDGTIEKVKTQKASEIRQGLATVEPIEVERPDTTSLPSEIIVREPLPQIRGTITQDPRKRIFIGDLGTPKPFSEFGLIDVPVGIGVVTGEVAARVTPEFELVTPEVTIPRKETIVPSQAQVPIGQLSFAETVTPSKEISRGVGQVIGTTAPLFFTPESVLIAGGIDIAVRGTTPEKRLTGGFLAGGTILIKTGRGIIKTKDIAKVKALGGERASLTVDPVTLKIEPNIIKTTPGVSPQTLISKARAKGDIIRPEVKILDSGVRETEEGLKYVEIFEGRSRAGTTQIGRENLITFKLPGEKSFRNIKDLPKTRQLEILDLAGFNPTQSTTLLRKTLPTDTASGTFATIEVSQSIDKVGRLVGKQEFRILSTEATVTPQAKLGGVNIRRGKPSELNLNVITGQLEGQNLARGFKLTKRAIVTRKGTRIKPIEVSRVTSEGKLIKTTTLPREDSFFGKAVDFSKGISIEEGIIPKRPKVISKIEDILSGSGKADVRIEESFKLDPLAVESAVANLPSGSSKQLLKSLREQSIKQGTDIKSIVAPLITSKVPKTPKPSTKGLPSLELTPTIRTFPPLSQVRTPVVQEEVQFISQLPRQPQLQGITPLVRQPSAITPTIKRIERLKPSDLTKLGQQQISDINTRLRQRSSDITNLLKRSGLTTTQTNVLRERQTQLSSIASALSNRQRLSTRQAQILKQTFKKPVVARPPTVPKIPKLPKLPSGLTKTQVQKIAKGFSPLFEVQVKRQGSFRTISKQLLPKGKALKLGAERTKATLARTFRLVPKGVSKKKVKDTKFVPSNVVFRPPKKNGKKFPLTFIQRRKFSLSSGSERAEIKVAKRLAPKKRKRKRRK